MATLTNPVMLDDTGKQIATKIDNMADSLTNVLTDISNKIKFRSYTLYGFHINGNESDPEAAVTYLEDSIGMTPAKMNYSTGKFDYGSWKDAFFMPRPCMVNYEASGYKDVVAYYLNENNYGLKEDGSASDVADLTFEGNAMMEWGREGKQIWVKVKPDSNDHNSASIYISDTQVDSDFHAWSFINNQGDLVNHFYTPIYNGSVDEDGRLRSISGVTVSDSKTAQQEIDAALLNNKSSNVLWYVETYSDRIFINYLLILIGKSLDCRTVFGQGIYTGGSKDWNQAYLTGSKNTYGLFHGTNSGSANSANTIKVFGMENYWGFQWRRIAGEVLVSGQHKVKMTYPYNLTGSDYTVVGRQPTASSGGYITKEYFDMETGAMLPDKADGSSSTYYCNGIWINNSSGFTAVPIVGGLSSDGLLVGPFDWSLFYSAAFAGWGAGAAASYKPLSK